MAHTQHNKRGPTIPWFCQLLPPFGPSFTEIAKPLYRLVEDEATFLWMNERGSIIEKLCHLLTTTLSLVYPDFNRKFILDTDASGVGI